MIESSPKLKDIDITVQHRGENNKKPLFLHPG